MAERKRYVRNIVLNRQEQYVHFIMHDFLTRMGMKQRQFKGEYVFSKGTGMFCPVKFLTYSYQNGCVHIEAWMRPVWLPGLYMGENDLSGFYGVAPKQIYKNEIDNLINVLCQPLQGEPIMQYPITDGYGQMIGWAGGACVQG